MPFSSLASRAISGFNGGDPSKYPGAFPPPAGVVPNLVNPPDAGRVTGIACLTVFLAVSTFLFSVRFYVKIFLTRRVLLEDVTCLISWAMVVVITATSTMMIHYGLGRHSWDIAVDNYSMLLKWLYVTSIVYEPAAFFTKVTLLLLLARVFAVNVPLAHGIYAYLIALCVAYIPIFGLKIGLCGPPSAFWDPDVPGECLNLRQIFIVDVAFAIATDLLIFIIPIPSTWRMRIGWRKKLKIILLLGAGGVATAVTIFRLVKLAKYLESKDVASDFILIDLLTVLEIVIGLSCSCLPALNILIEHRRQPGQHANAPRTGFHRRAGAGGAADHAPGIAWNWLNASLSVSPRVSPKWPCSFSRGSKSCHQWTDGQGSFTQAHFDVELAHFSGRGRVASDTSALAGGVCDSRNVDVTCPREAWFPGKKITACDGRREGWLQSCAHTENADNGTNDESPATLAASGRGSDESAQSKQSRDISAMLAELSGNKPWGFIWDGRSNQIDNSSHVSTVSAGPSFPIPGLRGQ